MKHLENHFFQLALTFFFSFEFRMLLPILLAKVPHVTAHFGLILLEATHIHISNTSLVFGPFRGELALTNRMRGSHLISHLSSHRCKKKFLRDRCSPYIPFKKKETATVFIELNAPGV